MCTDEDDLLLGSCAAARAEVELAAEHVVAGPPWPGVEVELMVVRRLLPLSPGDDGGRRAAQVLERRVDGPKGLRAAVAGSHAAGGRVQSVEDVGGARVITATGTAVSAARIIATIVTIVIAVVATPTATRIIVSIGVDVRIRVVVGRSCIATAARIIVGIDIAIRIRI